MTKITKKSNIRNEDVARTLSSDSSVSKTPTDSAALAQQLGSEASWADRYVPPTTGETIMTPASSVADHSERSLDGDAGFLVPTDAPPPTYEEVTSSSSTSSQGPSQSRGGPPTFSSQSPRRPNLPGRRYSRHETSQSIIGEFTLHDSLHLTTTSGTISIRLDVQPSDDPAHLTIKTESGSVSIHDKQADIAMTHSRGNRTSSRSSGGGLFSFLLGSRSNANQIEAPPIATSDDPRKQPGQHLSQPEQSANTTPPARVILTTIETGSGSVNGHLLVTATSRLAITTQSGSINLRLVTADSSSPSTSESYHPFSKLEAEDSRLTANANAARDLTSTIATTSSSGSQNINITKGISDTSSGALISAVQARHHSLGSASVHCSYPREWEGLVHASVGGSGTVNVHGNGLQLDRRGNKEVWAWRGPDLPDVEKAIVVRCDGSSTVNFSC